MRNERINSETHIVGIALILIMVAIVGLVLCDCNIVAESNTIVAGVAQNTNDTEYASSLVLTNDQLQFEDEEDIILRFDVNTSKTIAYMGYEGIIPKSVEAEGNAICVELNRPQSENSVFTLHLTLSDGGELSRSVYIYTNEYGSFIDTVSAVDSYNVFAQYADEQGILLEQRSDEVYSQILRENGLAIETVSESSTEEESIATRAAVVDTYVRGTLQWKDDWGTVHPLRGVQVEIYDKDLGIVREKLGTVYTNDSGYFNFGFANDTGALENGGYDIVVEILAGDDNVHMVKDDGSEYRYVSSEYSNIGTGDDIELNITFAMSYDNDMEGFKQAKLGQAFQITQAAMTARDFAEAMMGTTPSDVEIYFTDEAGCWYSSNKKIYISTYSYEYSLAHAYASWDVIMHEYGHHIQYEMDIIDSPGGSHRISENNADSRKNKEVGVKLTWGESWNTVFGIIAQLYSLDNISNVVTVGDDSYTAYNFVDKAFNSSVTALGEACEESVIAVLYDLFDDDGDTESRDQITLSYQDWWDVTTGGQAKTFSDFINDFYAEYPEYIDEMGELLSYYSMAPTAVDQVAIGDDLPTFTWTGQGGSTYYPNNTFTLIAFDENYEEYATAGVASGSKDLSITLTEDEWEEFCDLPGSIMHIAVVGMQLSSPSTGPYISAFKDFEEKALFSYTTSGGEVTITGVYGNPQAIAIPSSINGLPVTSIADYAFQGNQSAITATLPETVTSVGEGAFMDCNNFMTLNAQFAHFTRIETAAFGTAADPLALIYLPAGITYVGPFGVAMSSPRMWNGDPFDMSEVTYIGAYAFAQSTNIEFNATSALTFIGGHAFEDSDLSGSINIPASVATIESWAFNGCDITVYAESASKPSGWSNSWNNEDRPVIWNCTLSSDKSYVVSAYKSSGSIINASNGLTAPTREGYSFGGWYTTSDYTGTAYIDITTAPNGRLYAKWTESSCVAVGTMITLADGTQKAVEQLTGEEMLLVWNMYTGQFDSAPILFIDKDSSGTYKVITLEFSDGTTVDVIDEHAFWDFDLNRYVFLREDAAQYIGHSFNKQTVGDDGEMTYVAVELIGVVTEERYTSAYSPVTYGHLCYYVNGMLSMPGATEGLIDIFEVDEETMKYDAEAMAEDIAEYGLFTYEEFAEIYDVPEIMFDAFNGQYLKVAIGKGLIDEESLARLAERYGAFFAE